MKSKIMLMTMMNEKELKGWMIGVEMEFDGRREKKRVRRKRRNAGRTSA